MDYSFLSAAGLLSTGAEALTPGADTGAIATGTLTGLDIGAQLAQVSVAGSEPVWVPARPAIYPAGVRVRLLRSPLDGGRLSYCLGPFSTGDTIVGGEVTAIDAASGLMTVNTMGMTAVIPYNAGTYAAGTKVHVQRDPDKFGQPVHVLGPQGNYVAPEPEKPSEGATNPPQRVGRQAVIVPQGSGSWRQTQGRWDTWNTDRYGFVSALWQGNAYNSGPMTGLATYGDQIVGLNAVSIDRMVVTVTRSDSSVSNPRTPVVQPSPHGARPGGAPTVTGAATAGPGLTPGQGAQFDLPSSVFEGFRTGAYKGLATVGSEYAAFWGTARADGFALTIQYSVIA